MTFHIFLEDLIKDLGGFGRYQFMIAFITHTAKGVVAWSMLQMTLNGAMPEWWCADSLQDQNYTLKMIKNLTSPKQCSLQNTTCAEFLYDDSMNTIVNEWTLVCDRKWITATVTTIQFAGVLIGNFAAGHFADTFGRKPTFFLAMLTLIVFNIIAYFSVSWEMYAAIRFAIGLGMGFYLTVQLSLMFEFLTSRWRPIMASVPSWAMASGLFALACWLIHDWQWIHIATAAVGIPFLLLWWIMPESFRWLITREKFPEAEKILKSIAKVNGKPLPDLKKIEAKAKEELEESENSDGKKHYSVVDLFRGFEMVKTTLCLSFIWLSCGYGYYAITFGVQALSGNLYLNIFLVSIIESPALMTIMFLSNWIGRKKTMMLFFFPSGVAAVIVGAVQYIDTDLRGSVTNGLALVAKLGVSCAWGALGIISQELYPTVVRNISYGLHNTAARVGAMVAPQMVYLNDSIPGILFFLCGGFMLASGLVSCVFQETKGMALKDTLDSDKDSESSLENNVEIEKENKLKLPETFNYNNTNNMKLESTRL